MTRLAATLCALLAALGLTTAHAQPAPPALVSVGGDLYVGPHAGARAYATVPGEGSIGWVGPQGGTLQTWRPGERVALALYDEAWNLLALTEPAAVPAGWRLYLPSVSTTTTRPAGPR